MCAREGQWLPLLCHSQLCSIPPQKVCWKLCFVCNNIVCLQSNLSISISIASIFCTANELLPLSLLQVLLIVDKHFSDLSLREHLHLAVSSMVTRGTSPSLEHVREIFMESMNIKYASIKYAGCRVQGGL